MSEINSHVLPILGLPPQKLVIRTMLVPKEVKYIHQVVPVRMIKHLGQWIPAELEVVQMPVIIHKVVQFPVLISDLTPSGLS